MQPVLKDFEVIGLELPGRGRRMDETLLRDFDQAALDIYHQLTGRLSYGDFLIYGHSLGAYLALRVSNILRRSGRRPVCLIVSGNAGPDMRGDKHTYLLDRYEFIEVLDSLGGLPVEMKYNDELFSYFEPILRADFEVAERNSMSDEPPVDVPVFAMMGNLEEKADKIANWGRFTSKAFGYEILEGDHFFIYKQVEQVANIIKDCYDKEKRKY